MTLAEESFHKLGKLSREISLESAVRELMVEMGGVVVRDEQVDYSNAESAFTVYKLPDTSRLVWFRLYGVESVEIDMDQLPVHFDNVISEEDLVN